MSATDQPRRASVAERAQGPDLAGAAGEDRGPHAGAAGLPPVFAEEDRADRHQEHLRIQVKSKQLCIVVIISNMFRTPFLQHHLHSTTPVQHVWGWRSRPSDMGNTN